MQSNKIIVWERSNKLGKWCPYSSDVCQFLEKNYKKNISVICLGEVDDALKIYSVNFKDMLQVSEVTGTKSPIRRSLCDSLCALGRGFSWQWHDDHDVWNTYETEVNNFIDCAFLEGKKSISLNRKFPGYPYEIVFSKMLQINKHTKRKRRIRRNEISSAYPIESCSEDDTDLNNCESSILKVQQALNPEFLAKEIPGTNDLISQVNAYKRNVESPEMIDITSDKTMENNTNIASSKHIRYSVDVDDSNKDSYVEQNTSVPPTTVALVDGKPWTDSRPPHTPQSKLKPVPGIEPLPKLEKQKKNKRKGSVKTCPVEVINVLEKYTETVHLPPDCNETCIICCEHLLEGSSYGGDKTVSKLTLCSHIFHKACIEAMYNSGNKEFLQCPSCKKIHGEKCGIQPPGEMIYHVLPYSLPGYPEYDTIRIIYDFHSGIQGPEHPNPGRKYTARGFPRHCYLPDNEMGRKILKLLIKAWKRRLIFTIGRSSTTGEENTVTWNEIHHKTEFGCNKRGHGYPDPNYFNNVLAELEAHGIIDDEVRVWSPV